MNDEHPRDGYIFFAWLSRNHDDPGMKTMTDIEMVPPGTVLRIMNIKEYV